MEVNTKTKRTLKDISPDIESNLRNKKHLGGKSSMMSNDTFTWAMFEEKMGKMLETVAKKSDIQQLQNCIDDLKKENDRLRNDLASLKRKVETMDKYSRRSNIVVSGITSENDKDAKQKFEHLCTNTLHSKVGICRMIRMKTPGEYVVELESPIQATNLMINSGKLKGTNIFIQPDYTPNERSQRYHLRQLKKVVQKCDKNLICTWRGTTLIINNKSFTWNEDSVVAYNDEAKQFLDNLLVKENAKYNVTQKSKNQLEPRYNGNIVKHLTPADINAAV